MLFVLFLDINECLSNPCHLNASCIDNEGSFHCQCNDGFSGDGISSCASRTLINLTYIPNTLYFVIDHGPFFFHFSDIDECARMLCHVSADCLDSHGSYICRCKTGFNGNGTFCESNVQEYKFGLQFSPGV